MRRHEGDLIVRNWRPADGAELAAIWHCAWHASHAGISPAEVVAFRSPAYFEERVTKLRSVVVVASGRGSILGFASWNDRELNQLFVRSSDRGAGAGSALLKYAEAELRGNGVLRAHLSCRVGNEVARTFYERRGWTVARVDQLELECADGVACALSYRMEKAL